MKVKEFLSQGIYMNDEIRTKEEELEMLEETIAYKSPILKDKLADRGYRANATEELICKIVDYKEVITKDLIKLIDIKTNIIEEISKLEDSTMRNIFFLRYVKFYNWENISKETFYSIRQIHNLHNKGIKELEALHSIAHGSCVTIQE